ncbi:MAG: putative quinol monooxygenase [Actinomycetota bacterium]|nr:putative quinol monooxygenase [Actinomycetota bacterium]
MIVIAGTIAFDPDKAEQMLASATTLMEATRAEEGCLDYVMAADPLIPGLLRLFERWENEEHLGAHMAASHSRTFQKSLGDCGVSGVSIDRYEVASVTKLL